jgi:hypothetical protein
MESPLSYGLGRRNHSHPEAGAGYAACWGLDGEGMGEASEVCTTTPSCFVSAFSERDGEEAGMGDGEGGGEFRLPLPHLCLAGVDYTW